MKVEVKNKFSEIEYPCLMICKQYNEIVLFNDYRSGTCINPGSSDDMLGLYCDIWVIEEFTKFEGEITLKND